MQKQAKTLMFFTVVSAPVGLFLRWLQNNNIYEPDTGLPIKSPISVIFLLFCFAYAAALFFLTRRLDDAWVEDDFRIALRGKTIAYPLVASGLGVITAIGALTYIFTPQTVHPGIQLGMGLLGLVTAICLPAIAMGPKKDSTGIFSCVYTFLPVVFFCFWLFTGFKEHSSNPVLWYYVIEILALSGLILGYYYMAGYAFLRPRMKRSIFWSQMGGFLSIVTLGDARPVAMQLILFASGIMLLMQSYVLISNAKQTRKEFVRAEDAASDLSSEDLSDVPLEEDDEFYNL